tara:strand:+ start:44 stop:553 length:510 start_codon:yes stop_codon:yes gene_type:complete
MKMKMQNNEQKTAFAARVVNSQDNWLSTDELYEMIDKRSVHTTVERFGSNLSDAFKKGMVNKCRGLDSQGKRRILYASTTVHPDETVGLILHQGEIVEIEKKVKRTDHHKLPTVLDVPLGVLIGYVTDVRRDDLMSVLQDLIYSTSLRELQERYPALEDILFDIVGGDE